MELRKCECGGDAHAICDGEHEDGLSWFIGCDDCFRCTALFDFKSEAIQAWNKGKV